MKLHIWEVSTWENTLDKLPLGKNPLGKYLTSIRRHLIKNIFSKKNLIQICIIIWYILGNDISFIKAALQKKFHFYTEIRIIKIVDVK